MRNATWRISEPVTMVTDYVLGALAAGLAGVLVYRGLAGDRAAIALWGAAFVTTALAAFVGGTVHGFAIPLGPARKELLWKATLYLLGITSFLMLASAIATLPAQVKPWLLAVAALKEILYLAWVARRAEFVVAMVDYGLTLLLVLALQLWVDGPAAGWIAAGIALSVVGALVQRSGLVLHRHFNHNDLYHVVQMGAVYLFYRGGLLL